MINQDIDSERHYDESFYKFASTKVIEQHYPLIGEIVALFNSLDDLVSEGLASIINSYSIEIGWTVISKLTFSNKIELWDRILRLYIKQSKYLKADQKLAEIQTVEKIHADLKSISEMRNKIVHADWEGMNEGLLVKSGTKTNKNGVTHQYVSINLDEFATILERLDAVYDDFSRYEDKIIGILKIRLPD